MRHSQVEPWDALAYGIQNQIGHKLKIPRRVHAHKLEVFATNLINNVGQQQRGKKIEWNKNETTKQKIAQKAWREKKNV